MCERKIKEKGGGRKEEGGKKINSRNPARILLRTYLIVKSDIKSCIVFLQKGACTYCFVLVSGSAFFKSLIEPFACV